MSTDLKKKPALDTIGERMRYVRRALNLSQEEVARIIGMTKQTLIRYEKNTRKPNENCLKLFAKSFNVDIAWLLSGQGVEYDSVQRPIWPLVEYHRHLLYGIYQSFEQYCERNKRKFGSNGIDLSEKANLFIQVYEHFSDEQQDLRKQLNNKDFVLYVNVSSIEKLLNFGEKAKPIKPRARKK